MLKRLWIPAGVLLAALAAYVLWRTLDRAVLSTALQTLLEFPLHRIIAATALAAVSFLLAGVCEAAAVRHVGGTIGFAKPVLVTVIANPIGHALSIPTLSGGAVRYRMYTGWDLTRAEIARIVLLSAMPFVIGVTILLSAALLLASGQAAAALHIPVFVAVLTGVAGLCLSGGYIAATARGRFAARLPGLRLTLIQAVCGIAEILVVAAALYVFIPSTAHLGFAAFVAVYLIAVLLGQFSSVPAGLGVLEASLIVLLPQVPRGDLIAAALAYRVVFDVIPLIVALVLLALYETGSRRGIIGRWWRGEGAAS